MTIGGDNRTSLHRGDDRIVEDVDMVYGANEAGDQAALFQGRERVGGDPVLRMKHIEPSMLRIGEMVDVIGDARLHQFPYAAADGPGGDRNGLACGGPEKALASGIRGVHGAFVTQGDKRVRQFQRVDDAAARIGRMGEDRNAESSLAHFAVPTAPQPMNGFRAKSQMVSSAAASLMTTRRSAVTAPMALADRPRAEKRPTTAPTFEGATDKR
jgi:hypothetical protein